MSTPRDQAIQQLQRCLKQRGIADARVLRVFREVPRDRFCLPGDRPRAFEDEVLPLSAGVTLSQPSVVAAMLQALKLEPGDRVLEIGSGSGYSTALLCELAGSVRAIEVDPIWVERSRKSLSALGYANAQIFLGDGRLGDYDHAPYDAIILHMAVPYVPPALLDQLAVGARLVAPVGAGVQELLVYEADTQGAKLVETLFLVRFVAARSRDQS